MRWSLVAVYRSVVCSVSQSETAAATATSAPSEALDEAFPDRPTPADAEPLPTPDPAGASLAVGAFEVTETSWVRSTFDELDFLLEQADAIARYEQVGGAAGAGAVT